MALSLTTAAGVGLGLFRSWHVELAVLTPTSWSAFCGESSGLAISVDSIANATGVFLDLHGPSVIVCASPSLSPAVSVTILVTELTTTSPRPGKPTAIGSTSELPISPIPFSALPLDAGSSPLSTAVPLGSKKNY